MKYQPPYDKPSDSDEPYVDGNPAAGIQGSIARAAGAEHPQRELVHVIEAAGRASPDAADLYQVVKAIQSNLITYDDDTGSASALSVALNPDPGSYFAGLLVRVKAGNTNSANPTLNVNGHGAVAIKYTDGTDVGAAAWIAGSELEFCYDGTNFQLVSASITSIKQVIGSIGSSYWERNSGSGTFVVPDGIYWLLNVELTGGGGAGGGSASGLAGGGGNGGMVSRTPRLAVTPGQSISWAVGSGGTAGTAGGGNGGNGGDTTFGSLVAKAGKGGFANGNSGSTWDAGTVGTISLFGQQGKRSQIWLQPKQIAGEGGGTPSGGQGGNGSTGPAGTAGNSGIAPGGAGGGGADGTAGGGGANGRISFMY